MGAASHQTSGRLAELLCLPEEVWISPSTNHLQGSDSVLGRQICELHSAIRRRHVHTSTVHWHLAHGTKSRYRELSERSIRSRWNTGRLPLGNKTGVHLCSVVEPHDSSKDPAIRHEQIKSLKRESEVYALKGPFEGLLQPCAASHDSLAFHASMGQLRRGCARTGV